MNNAKTYLSSIGVRPQRIAAIEYVREGDRLVVTKIDRLARFVADLIEIIQILDPKKVGIHILNFGIDTH